LSSDSAAIAQRLLSDFTVMALRLRSDCATMVHFSLGDPKQLPRAFAAIATSLDRDDAAILR
jgi:hypothetical protein